VLFMSSSSATTAFRSLTLDDILLFGWQKGVEEVRERAAGNCELRSPPACCALIQSLDTTFVSYSGLLLAFPLCGVVGMSGSGGENGEW